MLALSIRQPWAWLILNAGKDIENRQWPTRYRGPILIHASKGMTKQEYNDVVEWLDIIGHSAQLPPPDMLERGGIVGSAEVTNCVTQSDSCWFCGEYGFVLRNVKPLPFRPYRGALGFFEVVQPIIPPGEQTQ